MTAPSGSHQEDDSDYRVNNLEDDWADGLNEVSENPPTASISSSDAEDVLNDSFRRHTDSDPMEREESAFKHPMEREESAFSLSDDSEDHLSDGGLSEDSEDPTAASPAVEDVLDEPFGRLASEEEDLVKQVGADNDPFRPLTYVEEELVKKAMSDPWRKKVLVDHKGSNILITGEILCCLRPGGWLNDEVINLYFEILQERLNRQPEKFSKKLIEDGYDYNRVRRWTRNMGYGLQECEKIFVPVHDADHWSLAVVNNTEKKFQFFDSLGRNGSQVMENLAKYIVHEVRNKTKEHIDVSFWKKESVEGLPKQNGYDCGVFVIKYADFHSRGIGFMFGQKDMPYFRRRMALELLRLNPSLFAGYD